MYVLDRDVEQEGEKSCALCEGGVGGKIVCLYKRDYGFTTLIYIFRNKGRVLEQTGGDGPCPCAL